MRKDKNKIEEPMSGPGWTAYGEDPGNHDLEDFMDDEGDSSFKVSRRTQFAWKAQEKISTKWFKTLVKYFGRSVFDIGRGNFDEFVQMKRFTPRARYLLKNEWTIAQFGIYLIEYSIVDGVASSFYSLNYGVRYVFFTESQLTKNQKSNEKILVNLFKETEEFLHKTLADRTPPYTPDYLFR